MPYVAVSYRDEGLGQGALYDHFCVQKMTGWLTRVVHDPSVTTLEFSEYINKQKPHCLPLTPETPPLANNFGEEAAFIFLPGFTRKSSDSNPESHKIRMKFEEKLIQIAMTRGQPVLAVCAGSWTLWQAYGGTLIDVKDHNYGGGMMRLNLSEQLIKYNKMIHRVRAIRAHTHLPQSTYLEDCLRGQVIPVNSVHWKAVDATTKPPKNIQVSAISVHDEELAPLSRQSVPMRPDDSVEAFETESGVPMIGIQWHPEAFNVSEPISAPHQAIFSLIKTAGQTYLNRRRVCCEIRQLSESGCSFFKAPRVRPQLEEQITAQQLLSPEIKPRLD